MRVQTHTHKHLLVHRTLKVLTNVLTLPGTGGDCSSSFNSFNCNTVTNKTLTSPKINEDVAVTATATEINLIDGGATVGTTAIADGDGLLINDAGTMRVSTVQTLAAYLDDEITAMPNLITTAATTVGALDSGSITSGFTSIDVGAGAITTTGTGTIGNLVVDDVAVDGKVITMTGSSGDTFVTTVAANGATSLVTTDAAAAAAHLEITADGTVDINSAGVLTLDSGAAINIEPAAGSAILLDGTISVDAGVVTGATSITSTAFVGGLTGNVTGNASGTALTVTQAAQTAITSVGTLTAFRSTGIDDNADALAMTIDSSERIGIGTTSPQNPLEVSGNTNYLVRITQTGTNKHMFKTVGNGASMDFLADGANNYVGFNSTTSGDDIRFQTNDGNERVRILAAGGMTFNGDTAAENALDDYEEGTWAPTLVCSSSGSYSLDGGANAAAYTKIGRTVHIQGSIGIDGESSPNGNLRMSLPFTSFTGTDDTDNSMGNATLEGHGGTIVNGINIFVFGAAYAQFPFIADDGTFDYVDHTHVDTAFSIKFSFTYIAV